MPDDRWTSFKVTGNFKAPVARLYSMWATSSGIESWFLRLADFTKPDGVLRAKDELVQAGDKYLWRWHGYPDDVLEEREILEANGADLLRFRFSGNCAVSVAISQKEDLSIIQLTQSEIPIEENPAQNLFVHCQIGWTF
jgi:hypothetical protein